MWVMLPNVNQMLKQQRELVNSIIIIIIFTILFLWNELNEHNCVSKLNVSIRSI